MFNVKQKDSMDPPKGLPALPDPSIGKVVNAKNEDLTPNAKSSRGKMSADSRRLRQLFKHTVLAEKKTKVMKDRNWKGKSNRTSASSLGRKPQKGKVLPRIDLPIPDTLQHHNEATVETYTILRKRK